MFAFRRCGRVKADGNARLMAKRSGCVVWVNFDADSMQLGPFYWLGGPPGEPLPSLGDRIGRHTRGRKTTRLSIRVLGRAKFTKVESMDGLVQKLVGDL